jgi:hypothetical protein
MNRKIRKAMNYMCADASSVFPSWQIKKLKINWLKDRQLYRGVTNEGDIVVTPCVISTDINETKFLMDCITGSLYKDGVCKTSDHLKLLDVVEAEGLQKELLDKRTKALGG